VGEYVLITAAVASIAISLTAIPEGKLAERLPTTVAKAQSLVTRDARSHHVSAAQARCSFAHAPYRRPPLRYLYVSGWLDGRANAVSCVFAKATPYNSVARAAVAIRRNRVLVARLMRMKVTVTHAAHALVRGAASAC
jgi:hypothetical protein